MQAACDTCILTSLNERQLGSSNESGICKNHPIGCIPLFDIEATKGDIDIRLDKILTDRFSVE